MGRRTVTLLLVAVCVTGGLSSCSGGGGAARSEGGASPPTPAASSPSARPSVGGSPVPTRGKAPSTTFAVQTRKLQLSRGKDRPLPTTVWYPATGDGPFPVIVFSHGLTAKPSDYAGILTRWAKAGFVVAAPAYPHTSAGVADFQVIDLLNQPADASYVLTQVLALDSRAGDPLAGRLDRNHIGATGHSGGGITTLGMLSGTRDDRLTAAAVLAGRQVLPGAFTGTAIPVLFVHGERDATVRYADGLAAYKAVPWPKGMLTLPGAGHIVTSGRDFNLVADATTDFWRWTLYGDAGARGRLERRDNLTDDF